AARPWPPCVRWSRRAEAAGLSGQTVLRKLPPPDFSTRPRSQAWPDPTRLADVIYRTASPLLAREAKERTSFRLLGVGISGLTDGDIADPPDMLDPDATRRAAAERAMDKLREKFGDLSIGKGRGLRK